MASGGEMEFGEVANWSWMHGVLPGALLLMVGLYAWLQRSRARIAAAEIARERLLREELQAYNGLDLMFTSGSGDRSEEGASVRELGARVCRTIAEKSSFSRTMLLMRNGDGHLPCVSSIGVDDLTVAALERWAAKVVSEEASSDTNTLGSPGPGKNEKRSFQIKLGEWTEFDEEVASWKMSGRTERRQWRRAMVLPIRTKKLSDLRPGRLVGAIVVCSDGLRLPGKGAERRLQLENLLGPLEVLANNLGSAAEVDTLRQRLLRTEKLAGLGQLAAGFVHELAAPLTSVMGYAELIAETSAEQRVQHDARQIIQDAVTMRGTLRKLQNLWQPSPQVKEPVNLPVLIRQVAHRFAIVLAHRGIKLEVTAQGPIAPVDGIALRLEQMVEHLVEHAVRRIGDARSQDHAEDHAVRLSLSQTERAVHLMVSNTGPGFEDPARAFEPSFASEEHPLEKAEVELSICYGIVREHDGEIAAFNLQPHGAAVVVDLPVKVGAGAKDQGSVKQGLGTRV